MEDRQRPPYVVTEDIEHLLTQWARAHGFRLPGSSIFGDLRGRLVADLSECLATREGVPEILYLRHDELRGIAARELESRRDGAPFVTLDPHYFPDVSRVVDVTRRVVRNGDGSWKTLDGVGVRALHPPLDDQIRSVIQSLPPGIRTVRVLDDGLWTGKTTLTVTRSFAEHGVTVHEILVALLVESIPTLEWLREEGHPPIHPLVRTFSVEDGGVTDWVCERDYYPGVPQGGRTVASEQTDGRDVGAYYLDLDGTRRLGDPEAWATLSGPRIAWFSRRRIEDCITLFIAIEDASEHSITVGDLDRIPYGFGTDLRERFVDVLRRQLNQPLATEGGPNGPR